MAPAARRLSFAIASMMFVVYAAHAADQPADPFGAFVYQMFQQHQGKTLCSVGETNLGDLRAKVAQHLLANGSGPDASTQTVAIAMWTLFPCPFSPFRQELRPAGGDDLRGVWLFPQSEQPLRYGWQVDLPPATTKVRCELIGYFDPDELRTVAIAGPAQVCPLTDATLLEAGRGLPKVALWKMLRTGRLAVERSDVPNHVEEWDSYVVVAPFQVYEFRFEVGDLVQYLRREKGNEVNAATQFRHLKRLPS